MAQPSKKPRTRLSPEARRGQILDAAAALVIDQGLASVTMDGVADAAKVSPALLYHYYPNRTALLQAVLRREYERLHADQAVEDRASESFDDMIRRMTRLSLKQSEERGLLIERLFSEPAVVAAFEVENSADRRAAVRYLTRRMMTAHGLDETRAERVVELCMGITTAAGAFMVRTGAPRAEIEDLSVRMILAAIAAAAETT